MRDNAPAAFSDDELSPFVGVELFFDSGVLRFWNGYADISVDGAQFVGSGNLMTISGIDESPEIAARGVEMVLSGISTDLISIALRENYQNRLVRIYVGTIASDLTTSGYVVFAGRMDVMSIEENGETSTISLTAENRLIDLERPRSRRYTAEDQKNLYPGDLGLDYVNDLQDKTLDWGRPT